MNVNDCADEITNYFMQNCGACVSKKDYLEVVRLVNLVNSIPANSPRI
jgi:hypothetical protein